MNKYNHDFEISFRDADISGELTMHALVDFMQETARNHAQELGVDYSDEADDYYWIVVRTKVQFDVHPKIGEKIRIESFIEGVEKLFSVRRFNIYGENDMPIGYIIAYYLLMNRENNRPVKLRSLEGQENLYANVYEGEKLQKLKENLENVTKVVKRQVHSSDIDTNHHMNNAHYIRWIVDMFNVQELSLIRIQSIQIQYIKEVLEGEDVILERGMDGDKNEYVVGRSKEGSIHFISLVNSLKR